MFYINMNPKRIRQVDRIGAEQESVKKTGGPKPDSMAKDLQDIVNKMYKR